MSILHEIFGNDLSSDTFRSSFPTASKGSKIGKVAAHHDIPTAAARQSDLLKALKRFDYGDSALN